MSQKQVVVLEKSETVTKQMKRVFGGTLVKGYDVFLCTNKDEFFQVEKERVVDIIIVNVSDYLNDSLVEMLKSFRKKIIPIPKIILLIHQDFTNESLNLENEVDFVVDISEGFSPGEIQNIFIEMLEEENLSGVKKGAMNKAKQSSEDLHKESLDDIKAMLEKLDNNNNNNK